MNISFLFESPIIPNAGGIERVSYVLATEFKKFGHNAIFISTSKAKNEIKYESVQFKQLSIDSECKNAGINLIEIIKSNNIDVVINQSVLFSTIKLLPYLKQTNCIILTVLHNRPFPSLGQMRHILNHTYTHTLRETLIKRFAFTFTSLYSTFRKNQEKNIYSNIIKYSDRLILLSEKFKDRLIRYCSHIDTNVIDAVNNPNTFASQNVECSNKENIVIFVGRLIDPQKNIKGFIDVWNLFHKTHLDWNAIVVGDGPHRKIFECYAKDKQSKNLEFVGNQSDVASFYSRAKFICMTSSFEGWPMVLSEALSYGCIPFVYDTFESLHEIIKDGQNGIIIPPYNKYLMAESMSKIAKDSKKCLEMKDFAIKSTERFSADKIANIWLIKINDIAARKFHK